MEFIAKIVDLVNTFLWDYALLALLLGAGIIFTFRLKFIQVRKFGEGMRSLFGNFSLHGGKSEEGLSSFQALTTAIAAQVGTGNIAGAATAIASGGPGSIFWMWVSAFFGMATIYAEAVMAQHTRKVENGTVIGGPVYYIKYIFKGGFGKFLAGFFSVAIILALGFMGNMVQSNSIGVAFNNAFHVPTIAVGIFVAIVAAIIFIGGINRIASFTEKIVPIMALLYVVGSLIILVTHLPGVGTAFKDIFVGAFSPQSVAGGMLGVTVQKAMRFGVARGLFSNEAGMGSTPHAHATAKVSNPCEQGIIAMGALGSDAAIEAADVVLMDDDPQKIAKAIKISRKCLRIVYENIYFALGIKAICLILGALGIANMWMAIFADVGVMVIAVLNAIRALFVKNL